MSLMIGVFFFFKQKTAYEMRISDWSSDVCSSDLIAIGGQQFADPVALEDAAEIPASAVIVGELGVLVAVVDVIDVAQKFDVGPKPARSRALGIAFEHLMHLGRGRIALLLIFLLIFLVAHPRRAWRAIFRTWPHLRRVRFIIPHRVAEVGVRSEEHTSEPSH